MYQNTCGAAAAGAGVCAQTDNDCQDLIYKEPQVPPVETDYSGFDVVKATQVTHFFQAPKVNFAKSKWPQPRY